MTWKAYYRDSDKTLVSLGSDGATPPAGISAKDFGASRPVGVWNPETLEFDAVVKPRNIRTRDFVERFVASEYVGIMDDDDPSVRMLVEQLRTAPDVNLNSPKLSAALDYLISRGHIEDADRKAELLA